MRIIEQHTSVLIYGQIVLTLRYYKCFVGYNATNKLIINIEHSVESLTPHHLTIRTNIHLSSVSGPEPWLFLVATFKNDL